MSGLRGVLGGVLALVALQAVVSTDAAAGRVGGLFNDLAGLVERALSPAVPAIPDRRGAGDSLPPEAYLPQLPPGQYGPMPGLGHRRPKTPKPPKTAPAVVQA